MRFNFYGLILSLSLFMAYWLAAYRSGKRGLAKDLVWETLPWVLGFGILAATILYEIFFGIKK